MSIYRTATEELRARMDRARLENYAEIWLDDKRASEGVHASCYKLHALLHNRVEKEISRMLKIAFDIKTKGYEAKGGAARLVTMLEEMMETTRKLQKQNDEVLRSAISSNGCDTSCERGLGGDSGS